ncbi:peptidase M50 [Desulfosarcina ovata subsp. sediminis]|uniref:Peptidase M50 n=1 Tax=Desulfosarcina ovata subsp. sediminis TaxID=885957 RepID=A0A5K7ZI70_9BACT|nr:HlyD family efflux transporter periplasmic adaptor subunit [Desulfosarcina ovata]BBO81812.1 peptidase M50 [Desulfosarcina ovata subsp. sediminis]
MTESFFSNYWYRVAKLRPFLRETTIVSRHVYRGQVWYILKNRLSGSIHRFNAAAYALIGAMDGCRTVQEIWDNAGGQSNDDSPSQDAFIRLLGQLHNADLIQSDILPSTLQLVGTTAPAGEKSRWQQAANPFCIRIPLWDPDRFIQRWSVVVAPIFTPLAFVLWLLIVFSAVLLAVAHWPDLTGSLSERMISPHNLVILWLVYPLVKIFHEFGHAFAVKQWGGEVHEMGIMLLMLIPIPYVDATASAAFPDKQHRIAVAAMGMVVELLIASLALFVWLTVESGWVSTVAYNVVLIGGVSTILFNGNPLLRYDGYYILADLIEIPNLRQRSVRYLGYLLQRYLMGIDDAESPVTAPGERGWFLVYGPVAFAYRTAVILGLVLLMSQRFFIVGILIAIWGATSLLFFPAARHLSRFMRSPVVRRRRARLIGIGTFAALVVTLVLFILPVPLRTSTQGVVWLPEQSAVRAGTDCEVVELLAPTGHPVAKDAPLIRGVDPFIDTRIRIHQTHLEELYASYNAQPFYKRVERSMLLEKIALVKEDLRNAEEEREKLMVHSPARGKFILMDERNLPGRFVRQGELLGYIVADHRPTVRAVVPQADIGLVRECITGVEVRLAEQSATPLKARIDRIVPAADFNLPSVALGTAGGGDIPVDPTDPKGLRALDTIFQIDLNLLEAVQNPHIGGRVYVQIEHGRMPLILQAYRRLRQLLMRRFYV